MLALEVYQHSQVTGKHNQNRAFSMNRKIATAVQVLFGV